jgi:hypothetical protein
LGLFADAVVGKFYFRFKRVVQVFYQVLEGKFFRRAALGPAQVRHENHRPAILEDFVDGRNGGLEAGIVGHLEVVVQGNVVVHPDERFFTGKVVLVDCFHGSLGKDAESWVVACYVRRKIRFPPQGGKWAGAAPSVATRRRATGRRRGESGR